MAAAWYDEILRIRARQGRGEPLTEDEEGKLRAWKNAGGD